MEPPRTKRQKVNVACDNCRRKKTRCDGRQPVCFPCQQKAASGIRCSWKSSLDQSSTQSHAAQQNTTYHEPSPQIVGTKRDSSSTTMRTKLPTACFSQSSASPSGHSIQVMSLGEDVVTKSPRRQEILTVPDGISPSKHPVLAIVGATLEEDSREGFFGSSSAGSFMQIMKRVVQQKIGGDSSQTSNYRLDTQAKLGPGHNTWQHKPVDYVLPSRRRADMLMSIYWKYFYVLYPYLDKAQTLDHYERIWKANSSISDERSYMCLINVMFAIACQIDESIPVEDRQQAAHIFYMRSQEILDVLSPGSVCSVQTFLLLGQYFQSTNEPHLCWTFTGLAIRTAQSLGLHLAGTSARASDLRARELMRKVWHGCILMDRVVSMTYGRPCMVGPEAAVTVPLPLAIDEDYLTAEALQPQSGQTCTVEFYVLSLKLYEILHDVMFKLYSVNCQPTQMVEGHNYSISLEQGHHSLFEIERKLSRWKASIPAQLQVPVGGKPQMEDAGAVLYRQAVILQQRQLHIRLLLLRPLLSNFITYEFHNGDLPVPLENLLSHRVYLQCAVVCVKIALEAIDTNYRERSSNVGEVGFCAEWWYNVLYLYISATILIAARLSNAILAEISEDSILNGWYRAIEILQEYSSYGQSIEQLITTLRLIFEAVPQQYSRFKVGSRQTQTEVSSISQNQNQDTTPLPYWRPMDPVDSLSTCLDDLTGETQDYTLPNDLFLEFETTFDPNDLSWLTTIPLDIDQGIKSGQSAA